MAWEDQYSRSEVKGGLPVIVPPTAVPDGARRGVEIPYVSRWIIIKNSGDVDLRLAWSEAALDAATPVYAPLEKGTPLTVSAAEAIRKFWIEAPSGGGDGEFWAMASHSRSPFADSHPELTVAAGFPEFDPSDTDAIIPGVG